MNSNWTEHDSDQRARGERTTRGASRTRVAITIVAMVAAAAFLFWPEAEHSTTTDGSTGRAATVGKDEDGHSHEQAGEAAAQLYTCGMHPQVLSEEPGTCPICSMRLTPVKVESQPQPVEPVTQQGKAQRKIKYWRAPMDPTYVSDRPGKSPMGMDLVPVYEDEASDATPVISISPAVVQNMGVRTAPTRRMHLIRTIRTVGRIDYAETLVRDVSTKFEGWIEELYADYTGQYIEKGMPLFSIYSRELYSSQEEYLLALRNRDAVRGDLLPEARTQMQELIESSRMRLKLFDISDEQINELARRGEPSKTMTIVSPHTGVIVEKNARDGMHTAPGTKLYTIADLSRVWVYVDIFENEVPFVKLGQDAVMELSYLPGQVLHGKVIYVYPFVDTKTRTVKGRLEFENPHLELKPGMFADIRIESDLGKNGVVVPRSAVIDTGRRQIAFVALGEGRFEPREITMGVDLGSDEVEVLRGLLENELVVVSGQFLLDSESKLREAVLKMIEQKRVRTAGQAAAGETAPAVDASSDDTHAAHDAKRAKPEPIEGVLGSVPRLADETDAVVTAYLDLHGTLARDDTQQFREAAARLNEPLQRLAAATEEADRPASRAVLALTENALGVLGRMSAASPDAVRASFIELSEDVIAIVRAVGPDNLERDLHAFYCPMAGAHWVQEATEPANPYYGFSMLRCGEPVALSGKPESGR